MKGASALTIVCGILGIAFGVRAQTFDLSKDFSTTKNPNGVWSYNLGGDPVTTPGAAGGCAGWTPNGFFDGSILIAVETPNWGFPNNDWEVGDVTIHSYTWLLGGKSLFSNVTWRAPASGTIDISGKAWDAAFYADRDAGWALLVNGVEIAAHPSVIDLVRTDPEADFANNVVPGRSLTGITVAQNDVVEFRSIAATFYGHFMGVQLVITEDDCYPDCDQSGTLNINDFICFQTKFALGDPYADCDGNGTRNINDFICFQTKFALGCP